MSISTFKKWKKKLKILKTASQRFAYYNSRVGPNFIHFRHRNRHHTDFWFCNHRVPPSSNFFFQFFFENVAHRTFVEKCMRRVSLRRNRVTTTDLCYRVQWFFLPVVPFIMLNRLTWSHRVNHTKMFGMNTKSYYFNFRNFHYFNLQKCWETQCRWFWWRNMGKHGESKANHICSQSGVQMLVLLYTMQTTVFLLGVNILSYVTYKNKQITRTEQRKKHCLLNTIFACAMTRHIVTSVTQRLTTQRTFNYTFFCMKS